MKIHNKNPDAGRVAMSGFFRVIVSEGYVLAISVLLLGAGCGGGDRKAAMMEEIDSLKLEKQELARELEEAKAQNEKAKERIGVLSGLGDERFESLYELEQVKIHKYTNLFDKDEDGKYEKLIVYLQPIDVKGDIVKAGGSAEVELWDLSKGDDGALLGKWQVGPEELKEMWFATLIMINYRLMFDVSKIIDEFKEPLTVKVVFTDYLSGKVFKEQKVIEP